ncbi:MAG: GatB/YqeY domain-containing protein [Candidatus Cloacimonadota bacterium]|nr:MAG: GatB/YqeY domain-containing protein [Candidatus Cloacimonadota bacterium]
MKKRIERDFIEALRSKDKFRLNVLRSLKAAFKYQEIEQKKELSDEEMIAILNGQVKSRKQAIELYLQGNRPELAKVEQNEIEIISWYLPRQLSEEELKQEVKQIITVFDAKSMKDMGRVMKALKEKLGSTADGKILSTLVRAALQN